MIRLFFYLLCVSIIYVDHFAVNTMGLGPQNLLQTAIILKRDEAEAPGLFGAGVPRDKYVGNFPETTKVVAQREVLGHGVEAPDKQPLIHVLFFLFVF